MYKIGTKIITKKNHPCGGNEWIIIRNGVDYKVKCGCCGHIVIITPDELQKRIKKVIEPSAVEK